MAIKVKEILKSVNSYTRGNDGTINATDEFKAHFTTQLTELKDTLKNDDKTVSEVIKTIDDLVFNLLDYRYNIVDYCHYSDDDDDNSTAHAHLRLK